MMGVVNLPASERNWDYWQMASFTNWESGKFKYYTSGEAWINLTHAEDFLYRASANLAYEASNNLTLEAHYSLIFNRPLSEKHFFRNQRVELEVNPAYTSKSGISVIWVNRFELLKLQEVSSLQYIFRHRTKVRFPLTNFGRIKSINIADEIFYDFNFQTVVQNRFTPVELEVEIHSASRLSIFFLIRTLRTVDFWENSYVFGSFIEF